MAMQHYKGRKLGEFDYDDEVFKLERYSDDNLRYIGKETDGSKIHIPEGIIYCGGMFEACSFLETPPIIPDSVENCEYMFYSCKSLKTAPIIPDGVENCCAMFYYCESLETPPVIPDSVENCDGMFCDCKSLKTVPIIPDSVEKCSMFDGCSKDIQEAGEWNIEHRGESCEDILDKAIKKYGLSDISKDFDLSMKMERVKQFKIDARKKQVSSEFGNLEKIDNSEQHVKNIGE